MSNGESTVQDSAGWSRLDPRSLALMRIALGVIILLDQLLRLTDLQAFYTDEGVLPRTTLLGSSLSDSWLSVHLTTGSGFGEALLLLITAGLAVGLIAGWKTPWMTLGCWFMLNSLHARNLFVNDRGDTQLVLMLFWACFLPLGACWSVDSRRRSVPLEAARGFPAAALIVQLAMIYVFAALTKNGDYWLVRGDALSYSLASPIFAGDLAGWLLVVAKPYLRLATYLVIAGELFAGALLLVPFSVSMLRGLAVILIAGFHLGVAVLFNLGFFPFIGMASIVALIPSEFWDAIPATRSNFEAGPKLSHRLRLLRAGFLSLCLGLSLLSNLSSLPWLSANAPPRWLLKTTQVLKLEQHWDLFSPLPPINGQFRVLAIDRSGKARVLYQAPKTEQTPEASDFLSHRWKMLMLTTIFPDYPFIRESVARRLAEKFGGTREGETIRYEFVLNPMGKNGGFEPPRILPLWSGDRHKASGLMRL